jgi:hypothetical protein
LPPSSNPPRSWCSVSDRRLSNRVQPPSSRQNLRMRSICNRVRLQSSRRIRRTRLLPDAGFGSLNHRILGKDGKYSGCALEFEFRNSLAYEAYATGRSSAAREKPRAREAFATGHNSQLAKSLAHAKPLQQGTTRSSRKKTNPKTHTKSNPAKARFTPQQEANSPSVRTSTQLYSVFTPKYCGAPF